MTGRLIVSPHLDDAVLSCWHALAGASEPATVVTLFAGVPAAATQLSRWDRASGATDAAEQMRVRRLEDEAALTSCGARFVHCEFLDDQYRGWASHRKALVSRVTALAQDADEVWIPAGFGGHPDHVLTAEAALSATGGRRRVLYADLPYATRDPAAIRRSDPTPPKGHVTLREKVRSALIASPYAPRDRPLSYRLSGPEQNAKRRCLEEYHSQLPVLTERFPGWWQDPEVFGWEWWWPLDGQGSSRRAAMPRRIVPHWSIRRLRQRRTLSFPPGRRHRGSAAQAGRFRPPSSPITPTSPGGTVLPNRPVTAS